MIFQLTPTISSISQPKRKFCSFYFLHWPLLFVLFLSSCVPNDQNHQSTDQPQFSSIRYAKGFKLEAFPGYFHLTIFNPWQKREILQEVLLVSDHSQLPDSIGFMSQIKVPVKSMAALSSTQWGPLIKLDRVQVVKGVSESAFIADTLMNQLVKRGEVVDLASDGQYDIEKLMVMKPEVILFSPDPTGVPTPLKMTGLPMIAWPDYFETDPLGRTEWMKILGVLSGVSQESVVLFDSIATSYEQLKSLAARVTERPVVFADKAFAGQWYVPGGKSYMSQIFKDAGATYVFSDNESEASFPLDIETILAKAGDADYWRIAQAARGQYGYAEIKSENEIYASFKAFKDHKVIYCNSFETAYFERGPLEPHLILADFIAVFHPTLLPGHKPVFHQLLKP